MSSIYFEKEVKRMLIWLDSVGLIDCRKAVMEHLVKVEFKYFLFSLALQKRPCLSNVYLQLFKFRSLTNMHL